MSDGLEDLAFKQKQRIAELEAELAKSKREAEGYFRYLTERCERLEQEHGVGVHHPAADDFRVTFESRRYPSRVEALKAAERLAAILHEEAIVAEVQC